MARAVALTMDVRKVISELEIDANSIRIKNQLPRPLYERVNKILELMGGKWNRKAKVHLFEQDPTDKVEDILLTGQIVDLKKEFDFFETPVDIAEAVVIKAHIHAGMKVLEPSAGRGVICDMVKGYAPTAKIEVCEIQPENQAILAKKGYRLMAEDFMAMFPSGKYDRVVMNPPFSKQQDIDHVTQAFSHLKEGGRLVAIMGASVTFRTNLKTDRFKSLLSSCGGEITPLPEDSFKSSGTNVNTVLVTMSKK